MGSNVYKHLLHIKQVLCYFPVQKNIYVTNISYSILIRRKNMGVTLNSKNYECDFGYNGFNRLRTTIAELVGSDLGEHYKKLDEPMLFSYPRLKPWD